MGVFNNSLLSQMDTSMFKTRSRAIKLAVATAIFWAALYGPMAMAVTGTAYAAERNSSQDPMAMAATGTSI